MLKQFFKFVVSLAAFGVMGTVVVQAKTLNFGIISTESSQSLKSIWEPFLKDMSKKTGYDVKPFFATDYAGVIQGMRFDKVDVAWFGNKSAIEAVDRAHGKVVAATVAAEGSPGYWSLLIVHKDSPINTVEDMLKDAKNLTFANGDPNSTSGYVVPSYYVFAKNHVDPNKIFKKTITGSHETNALAVANKQVDVGTFNTEGMDRLKKVHPDKAAELKEIWRSPLIPGDPIVIRDTLPQEEKDKIVNFLMTYGENEQEMKNLKLLEWDKFAKADNTHLLPVRQLELFKKKTTLQADSKLSQEEKDKQVKEIDAQLSDIEKQLKAKNAEEKN